MQYFDYENVARRAGISEQKLNHLRKMVREEFPQDDMMYELHLLRVCMTIQQGHITVDQALQFEEAA